MISIIIIVKNDPRIKILLNELTQIDVNEKYEILVIDASNGSLDSIKKLYSKVRWMQYRNNTNKKRTYAEQRNLGIKEAKGNIIVFIDADCIPHKDWLANLVDPILNQTEYVVSGAIKPLKNESIHKEEQYGKYRDECETMNLALSKETVDKVGFFDESLEGCEDSDYCIRLINQSYKILYEPRAIVYHDWGGIFQNITRSFHGGRDRMSLYKKYPNLLFTFSINNIYTVFYLLYILFLPIAFYYPLYILILLIPSIIKVRNPIKEIYNLAFSFGFIFQFVKHTLHI